jgi:hypothetical protein
MSKNRLISLLVMFSIAVLLFVAGYLTIPLATPTVAPGEDPPNVIVTLVPFIFFLIGILVAFIALIILLATLLNNKVPEPLYRWVSRLLIAGIFLGLLGMIQPFVIELYTWGFVLLFVCTLLYIVWSHLVPRGAPARDDQQSTVSVSEAERSL